MAGLGNRSQIREELPLSTRVHELAKELGLKSQELLERIQKWGLDVKANALASLDPPMVDRIRELMDQPASGTEATSLARTASARAGADPRRPPRGQRRGGRGIAARWPGGSRIGRGEPGAHRRRPRSRAGAVAPAASPPSTAAPQRLIPGSSPSASARPPASTPASAARAGGTAGGPRPAPGAVGAPVSPRRLFRNSAHRRPAFGPHDASRRGPAAGRGPRLPDKARDTSPGRVSLRPSRLPRPVRDRPAFNL